MKGYFRKRGNTWSFTLDVGKDEKGKRKQKTKSGFKTKKEAQAACADLINQLSKGTVIDSDKITMREYMGEWLDTTAKKKVRDTTFKNYKRAVEGRIIPFFDQIKLQDLKPHHAEKFISSMIEEGLSERYIEYVFVVLKGAINKAVQQERIIKSPLTYVEIPRPRRRKHNTWSIEEMKKFLSVAKFDNVNYYVVFLTALSTGMRRGEFLGLTWDDIDFTNNKIRVTKGLIYDEEGFRFGDLKTASSRRSIYIDEHLAKELKKHKARQNEIKMLFGKEYNDMNLVFTNEVGKPIYPRSLALVFDRITKNANVPKIRIHDLRHTHATLLLELGENPKVVSERLGHSSVKTTLDTYSHVTPSMQENTAMKIGKALNN